MGQGCCDASGGCGPFLPALHGAGSQSGLGGRLGAHLGVVGEKRRERSGGGPSSLRTRPLPACGPCIGRFGRGEPPAALEVATAPRGAGSDADRSVPLLRTVGQQRAGGRTGGCATSLTEGALRWVFSVLSVAEGGDRVFEIRMRLGYTNLIPAGFSCFVPLCLPGSATPHDTGPPYSVRSPPVRKQREHGPHSAPPRRHRTRLPSRPRRH